MRMKTLGSVFDAALFVRKPWKIQVIGLNKERKSLHVSFCFSGEDFEFKCPFCNSLIFDTFYPVGKTWNHLNFFQFDTRMSVTIPVFRCSNKTCIASKEREAIVNTLFLDVLLMVSPFDVKFAVGHLLACNCGQE